MGKYDYYDPVTLKVWCGRRDEAHRNQKGGLRAKLIEIEQRPTAMAVAWEEGKPIPAFYKFAYKRTSRRPMTIKYDWEKGRALWQVVPYESTKKRILEALEAEEKKIYYGEAFEDNEDYMRALSNYWHAGDQRVNTQKCYEEAPANGYIRLTCPTCGRVYRLMLFAEVAEWLDKQVGKTRYVSAERLEKLTLEMMRKNNITSAFAFNQT
ncbi:MAG: hypothetical protein E7L25_02615 [Varibaculum cambriense]|nr:hypothetical protein [Varibaculum cambriense]